MATIRIADVPHPKEEHPRTNLQDGVSSSGGDGIYGRQSFSRSGTADPLDDTYNIRSRSKPPSTNRCPWKTMGALSESVKRKIAVRTIALRANLMVNFAARLHQARSRAVPIASVAKMIVANSCGLKGSKRAGVRLLHDNGYGS
jgi:hypothetical protein